MLQAWQAALSVQLSQQMVVMMMNLHLWLSGCEGYLDDILASSGSCSG